MDGPPLPPPPPPSFATFLDKSGNSDLLNRLGAFLPQIEQANQELEAAENTTACMDATLVKDTGDDDDDDDDGDNDNKEDGKQNNNDLSSDSDNANPQTQMIELKVALGSLKDNPMISMLAKTNEDSDTEQDTTTTTTTNNNNSEEEHGGTSSEITAAISNMFATAEQSTGSKQATKEKKVLIEELS